MTHPSRDAVLPQWPGTPPEHALLIARAAQDCGYHRLWFGETAGFEAGVLGGRLTSVVPGMPLVVGPLPVPLRSGPQIAMLSASLQALGASTEVVIGASSPAITAGWHGRSSSTLKLLAGTVAAAKEAASGTRTKLPDSPSPTSGFRLGLPTAPFTIGMAALGPRTLHLAGAVADRVVMNFVPPQLMPEALDVVAEGARSAGRPTPPVTAWFHAGLNPDDASRQMARRFLSGYLRAPGYTTVFDRCGFESITNQAKNCPTRELESLVTDELLDTIFAFGDAETLLGRAHLFERLGVEIAVVPVVHRESAIGATLEALRPQTNV